MGLAASLAFLRGTYEDAHWIAALALWFIQLVFNGLWTPIYFGAFSPGLALAVLWLTLLFTVFDIAMLWFVDTLAFGLMIVYAVWLLFAASLNAYTVAVSDVDVLGRKIDAYKAARAQMDDAERPVEEGTSVLLLDAMRQGSLFDAPRFFS